MITPSRRQHEMRIRARPSRSLALLILLMLLVSAYFLIISSIPANQDPNTDRDWDIPPRTLGANVPEIYYGNVSGSTKEEVNVTIYVYDADNDPLHIEYEWGDGTPNGSADVTGTVDFPMVVVNHTWDGSIPGKGQYWVEFVMNVTATDVSDNSATVSIPVWIYVPFNWPPAVNMLGPSAPVDPSDAVVIVANASDPEGEALTWTFVYNDSVQDVFTEVYHTNATAPDELVWKNVTHVFGVEGNFSVTLNVSDALPPDQIFPHNISERIMVRVVANEPPMVSGIFSIPSSPVMMNVSLGYVLVDFFVSTIDMDGDVVTALWDFGDGSPIATNESEGGLVVYDFIQNHNYTTTGYYNVTVIISDGRLGHEVVNFLIMHVTSDDLPPYVVEWSSDPADNPLVGEVVTFTLIIGDHELDPIELVWNFSDGSPLVYVNLTDFVDGNVTSIVEHSFASAGSHEVKVEFTDNADGLFNHNVTSTYGIDVLPDDVPPVADAGTNLTVSFGTTVQFNGTGSYDNVGIVTYAWTFLYDGNLVTLAGPEPEFTFLIDGVYDVTLNVTDAAGNFGTDTMRVTVETAIPEFPSALASTIGIFVSFMILAIKRRSRND